MSVSFYFAGRSKKPTPIKVEKAEAELEDILSRECIEANSPYCRYYLENRLMKPKSIKHVRENDMEGKTLVVLGEEFRTIADEELLKPLTLYLRQPDSKTLKTTLKPIDTVSKIKELLQEKYKVPAPEWQLFYKGKEMANDYQLLLEYEVVDMAIIHSVKKQSSDECDVEIIFSSRKLRKTINIDIQKCIKQIKQQIEGVAGLAPAHQILVYLGGELSDDNTAASYHISPGAQIFLLDSNQTHQESRVDWLKGKDLESKQTIPGELDKKPSGEHNTKEQARKETSELQSEVIHQSKLSGASNEANVEPSVLPKEEVKSVFISSDLGSQRKQTVNQNQKHYPHPNLTITLSPSHSPEGSLEAPSPFLALKQVQSPQASCTEKSEQSGNVVGMKKQAEPFFSTHAVEVFGEGQSTGLVNTIAEGASGNVLAGIQLSGDGSSTLLNRNLLELDRQRNPLAKARIHLNTGDNYEVKQVESVIINGTEDIKEGNLLEHCKQAESMIEKSEHTQSEAFFEEAGLEQANQNRVTQSMKQKTSSTAVEQKKSPVYISTIERSPSQEAALNQSIELIPIKIVFTRPQEQSISENVAPDDSVESIKRRIESNHGYPVQKQVLKHQGSVIDNTKLVKELDWSNDAEVELSVEQ